MLCQSGSPRWRWPALPEPAVKTCLLPLNPFLGCTDSFHRKSMRNSHLLLALGVLAGAPLLRCLPRPNLAHSCRESCQLGGRRWACTITGALGLVTAAGTAWPAPTPRRHDVPAPAPPTQQAARCPLFRTAGVATAQPIQLEPQYYDTVFDWALQTNHTKQLSITEVRAALGGGAEPLACAQPRPATGASTLIAQHRMHKPLT